MRITLDTSAKYAILLSLAEKANIPELGNIDKNDVVAVEELYNRVITMETERIFNSAPTDNERNATRRRKALTDVKENGQGKTGFDVIRATDSAPTTPHAFNDEFTYEEFLRRYEWAYYMSSDYSAELHQLATVCTFSVINKLLDPTGRTATVPTAGGRYRDDYTPVEGKKEKKVPSYNGQMSRIKFSTIDDLRLLENTTYAVENSTVLKLDSAGEYIREKVINKRLAKSVNKLISCALSDGYDIIHEATLAILEESTKHATPDRGWIEAPYARRKPTHVVYKDDSEIGYTWEMVTPIQMVYRRIRRYVQSVRSVKFDPKNTFLYIDSTDPETLEKIYFRIGRYIDMGAETDVGYTVNAHYVDTYRDILSRLNLTDRQAEIIRHRMRGEGFRQIGSRLGVSAQAVLNAMKKVQAKAEKIGFTPSMWAEMTGNAVHIDRENDERRNGNTIGNDYVVFTIINHWNEMEKVYESDVLNEIMEEINNYING